jgi:hypothetical protein
MTSPDTDDSSVWMNLVNQCVIDGVIVITVSETTIATDHDQIDGDRVTNQGLHNDIATEQILLDVQKNTDVDHILETVKVVDTDDHAVHHKIVFVNE